MIGQYEPRACMGTGFAQRVIPELPGERRAHGQPAKALNAALALLKVERAGLYVIQGRIAHTS